MKLRFVSICTLHFILIRKSGTWINKKTIRTIRHHGAKWTVEMKNPHFSGNSLENFVLWENSFPKRESIQSQPITPIIRSGEWASSNKKCTISIRLRSEGGNDEKIQFNVQLKFPSIFYLRLPSHCAKDGHSFFHLCDYEYKWVWFLWGLRASYPEGVSEVDLSEILFDLLRSTSAPAVWASII